ncbi:MAG TPA: FtsW/RodA/SpoVE family cell cycle protein [Clostridiales bacterium]|nr:FtsW/RodA/SpoVE family cell cycle protein [Clostridiales bacterium]
MYFVEETKGVNYIKQFDYFLFTCVIVLTITGLVVLSSATRTMPGGTGIMRTQIVSIILGVIAALVIASLDYKILKSMGLVLYFASVAMLLYVLKWGVGYEEWGSRSWVLIPIIGSLRISFQPSEIAKISTVIMASIFLERIKEGQDINRDILKFIVYSAIPVGLILIQPDYGMTMIFLVALVLMVYICGIKYKYIVISFAALITSSPLIWFFALNDKRKKRILEFISPGSDPLGSSLQLDKAQLAIGSGRLYGSGLYKGIQTQIGSVPVKESDMIFSVIGEELGFIGSVLIICLVFIIIFRCIYVARNSRDHFGTFLVIGITGMIAFQFIQNIGMCLRLFPVTGLPLPFVSQGGSAMVTNYMSIGIILSVSMRRKRAMFQTNQ